MPNTQVDEDEEEYEYCIGGLKVRSINLWHNGWHTKSKIIN